jgi:hypothetical protein
MSKEQDDSARASRKIVLSYRREDSSGYAGRLHDQLAAHFGVENVFIDIDSIAPGVDFFDAIHQTLSKCGTVLVIIGKSWLNALKLDGSRRLDDPDDFVRLEVEAALSGTQRVIPVLVGGADMPSRSELPESLGNLSRRHAVELSDRRWRIDTQYLIDEIEKGWAVEEPVQEHQEGEWRLCPGVVRFSRDDQGFVAWRDSHPNGYVVNCDQRPRREYFKLHRTGCPHLNKSQSYTVSFMKLCAENKQPLDDCGLKLVGGRPDRCPICKP